MLIDAFYDAWDRDPRDNFKLLGDVASAVQDTGILDKAWARWCMQLMQHAPFYFTEYPLSAFKQRE